MGITVSYRGRLTRPDRVEDFEDRVLDLALELGGQAEVWRSAATADPKRVVRGVIVNLCPGQEPLALLVSPEGWLIGLTDIEPAEEGKLDEPPWCWVKTQFGSLEGHVALVEMLAALKEEFAQDLEIYDEGGYWETRDLAALKAKMGLVQAAIDGMAEHLERYGLSREAAEDPEIVAARVERIAHLVHRALRRPAEHPPVPLTDEDLRGPDDPPAGPESEARWEASYKENRRRQERVHRAIEEHLARGESFEEALDAALREETALGLPAEPSDAPAGWEDAEEGDVDDRLDDDADDAQSPWRASLPATAFDEEHQEDGQQGAKGDDDFAELDQHPLLQRAMDLISRLHKLLARPGETPRPSVESLMHGAGEIAGGLAQALGMQDVGALAGLSVVQLKRAMRGAAFAQGALFPLRDDGAIDAAVFDDLYKTLEGLQGDVFAELRRVREGAAGEE